MSNSKCNTVLVISQITVLDDDSCRNKQHIARYTVL